MDVIAGETLEYRLGVAGARGEEFFGATEVQVPVSTLSLTPRVANGHIAFAIELPSGDPASVALYDIVGRRVWSRTLRRRRGARSRRNRGWKAQLPQGVYFARLAQGRESRTARVALTR
jgi:hypothetical protein